MSNESSASGETGDEERKMEDVRLRVRSRLSASQVQLWLPPYTGPDSDQNLENLADDYAKHLNLEKETVLATLKELREHSVERLAANEHFKETGIASLRLTLSSPIDGVKTFNVEITLDSKGDDVISIIATKLSVPNDHIKLIHRGRVIKSPTTLASQNVKNGAQILVIVFTGSPEKMKKDGEMYSTLRKITSDAEMLSNDFIGESFMQLEDQSGNILTLPPHEKKALTVAMTLHEKGRTALKSEDYSLALVFLLEADKHFSDCNSKLLESVDNYGLLNLDISWCYLNLQSVTHIPDAEARLSVCEKTFHKCYGKKLERLIALKGSSGHEKALFMRLHLMQGIMSYHQNKREAAKTLLLRAQNELNGLKVNDSSLCNLVEMGYTLTEARLGLRASDGNVREAIEFISKSRKQKVEKAKKAEEERESRALGLCADGKQFVSVPLMKMLIDMGYTKSIAILALKKGNNCISDAVSIIQENPNMLTEFMKMDSKNFLANPQLVQQLIDIGYSSSMAALALKRSFNDLNGAIDLLTKGGGLIFDYVDGSGSTSHSFDPDLNQPSSSTEVKPSKMKKMKAAFSRLSEGIQNTEDDYLDISLEQEEKYLQQYLPLLD